MAFFAGLIAAMIALVAGEFSDDFNSYPNRHQLHGVNGWRGWANNSAAGAQTTVSFRRSNAKSVDITSTSNLVQPLTATSGKWQVTAWQYIPSSTTGANTYFTLLNTYSDSGTKNWSTQLYFNLTSNLVQDNLSGSVGSVAIVRNQWIPIVVDIDLGSNTQSIYYNSTLVGTVAWNRTGGAAALAALNLRGGAASHVYYDDITVTSTAVTVTVSRWREVTPDE